MLYACWYLAYYANDYELNDMYWIIFSVISLINTVGTFYFSLTIAILCFY